MKKAFPMMTEWVSCMKVLKKVQRKRWKKCGRRRRKMMRVEKVRMEVAPVGVGGGAGGGAGGDGDRGAGAGVDAGDMHRVLPCKESITLIGKKMKALTCTCLRSRQQSVLFLHTILPVLHQNILWMFSSSVRSLT